MIEDDNGSVTLLFVIDIDQDGDLVSFLNEIVGDHKLNVDVYKVLEYPTE